jgi:hypothetical protein
LEGAIHPGTKSENAIHVYVYTVPDPGVEYKSLGIKAEIGPRGTKHWKCWATQALPDDPAFCLAFRVTIHLKDDPRRAIITYPSNKGRYSLFKPFQGEFLCRLDGWRDR